MEEKNKPLPVHTRLLFVAPLHQFQFLPLSKLPLPKNFFEKSQTFFSKPLDKTHFMCYTISVKGREHRFTSRERF